MNFTKLFSVLGIVIISLIQTACGTATPTTLGYTQMVNGVCPTGYSVAPNTTDQCVLNNGYNNTYNNGYVNGAATCSAGTSYVNYNYGTCQAGYTLQGNNCVCQTSINQAGVTNGQCQAAGYSYVQGGCYNNPQNICYQGYVYVTPTGMCVRVQ